MMVSIIVNGFHRCMALRLRERQVKEKVKSISLDF